MKESTRTAILEAIWKALDEGTVSRGAIYDQVDQAIESWSPKDEEGDKRV